jgi:ribonuclease HI
MKTVNIYTDGGCSNNQSETNYGGWGAILEYNGHLKELYGSEANTTNNRMEMTALLEALRALKDTQLIINAYSDSSYLIECLRKRWYDKWRLNGWITSQKKPVENKDLWIALLERIESFQKINFFRIKGHLNPDKTAEIKKWHQKYQSYNHEIPIADFIKLVNYNNKADELANLGIDEIKTSK